MLFLSGMGAGGLLTLNGENKFLCQKQELAEKFRIMYQMMEKWMRLKQGGVSLAGFFQAAGYERIAIYGMGEIGQLLLCELNGSGIQVAYGIDRNENIKAEIPVYRPSPELKPVDAVVVTAIAYYDEIVPALHAFLDCPVLSMENIVAAQCYELELRPPELRR